MMTLFSTRKKRVSPSQLLRVFPSKRGSKFGGSAGVGSRSQETEEAMAATKRTFALYSKPFIQTEELAAAGHSPVSGEDPAFCFIVAQLVALDFFLGLYAEADPGNVLEPWDPDEFTGGLANAVGTIFKLGEGGINFLELLGAGFRQAQRDVGGLGVVGLVRLIPTRGRTVFVGSDMFGLESPKRSGQILPAQEELFTDGKESFF